MIRLTREEVYQLVWTKPMTEIAKKYLISDVGFRKTCIRLNIPIPKAGHWAKILAGQKESKPPLPTKWKGPAFVDLTERPLEQPVKKISELDLLVKQLSKERLLFKVPERLRNPDPLIIAAKESLSKLTDANHPGMSVTGKVELDIRVAPNNVGRALRFMDAIIKCIRARGHIYETAMDGNFILIRNIRLRVNFRERTTRFKTPHKPYQDFEWRPNGQLVFRLDGRQKAEWQDLKTLLLEEQLPKVLAKLELTAQQEEAHQEKTRQWQIAWELERKMQAEREARQRQELKQFKELLNQAKQWKQAQLIREYLAAMQNANPSYLAWAGYKADWLDPLTDTEDEWLNEVCKNNF